MNRIRPAVFFFVCLAFGALTCTIPAFAQTKLNIQPKRDRTSRALARGSAVLEFNKYIKERRCKSRRSAKCLETIEIKTCRSGCWRRGYNYRHNANKRGRLNIHLSIEYLRKLRDLVGQELSRGEKATSNYAFGMTLSDLLYSQVQMMLRQPAIKFKYPFVGKTWRTKRLGNVISGKSIDPNKFAGVVWTNAADKSHAMTQADAMKWFIDVGYMLASQGQGRRAEYFVKMGARFYTSFTVPHRFGGVRNDKPRFKCHGGKYCYLYHSQEVHDYSFPNAIINKNVYAIRDLAQTAHQLKHWEQFGSCQCCAKDFRKLSKKGGAGFSCSKPGAKIPAFALASKPKLADQMLDSARGGLFNLAYGPGNRSPGRSYRIPPPNLKDFMIPIFSKNVMVPNSSGNKLISKKTNQVQKYYFSSYGYWLDSYTRKYRRGVMVAKDFNNCHYHYLTLKLLWEVLELTETSNYYRSDRDFSDVRHCLLYGRPPGTPYKAGACFDARKGARNVRGVPLAEFYLSARTAELPYQVNHERCTDPASEFLSGDSPARKWFDQKYSKSTF